MTKVKLAFSLIAFQDDYILPQVLESIAPYGEVYAVEGPVAYWQKQGFTTSTDRTNDILNAHLPFERIRHGTWAEKDEMCNAVLDMVPDDVTHIFEVDADEVWKAEDLELIIACLEQRKLDSMAFHFQSFYGGFERVMTGFEYDYQVQRIQRYYPGARWATHRPPTILSPQGIPWRDCRHMDAPETAGIGVFGYHYSYVFASQMQRKAAYYEDRDPGGVIHGYFENVYLPWMNGDQAQKAAIEKQFSGVHNWLPARRGPCYTKPFEGEHPFHIRDSLPVLRERLKKELEAWT